MRLYIIQARYNVVVPNQPDLPFCRLGIKNSDFIHPRNLNRQDETARDVGAAVGSASNLRTRSRHEAIEEANFITGAIN